MAVTKKPRKKPKTKKPAPRYSPASQTTYPSEKAFNRTLETRARSQLDPVLNDIRARRKEELGAHATRGREIQGYYDQDLAARQAQQTRIQEALNGIMSRNDVMGAGAQEGLAAAMRQATAGNDAAAQQLGVQAPGVNPDLANTLAAYTKGNAMGLAGDFGQHLVRSAADIGLTGVERREAGEREGGVHSAALRALTGERSDAMKQLPGLRDAARTSMLQEILGNSQNKLAWRQFGLGRDQFGETVRSNKAQEDLAADQFDLAEDQFRESKKARRFDERMARDQSQLNWEQLALARDELTAKVDQATTEAEMAGAEDQAKKFDAAAEWLAGWLAPNDMDYAMRGDPKKKTFSPAAYKKRTGGPKAFHSALSQIITRFGVDRNTAYEILRTAEPYRSMAQRNQNAFNTKPSGGNEGAPPINRSPKKKKAKKKK